MFRVLYRISNMCQPGSFLCATAGCADLDNDRLIGITRGYRLQCLVWIGPLCIGIADHAEQHGTDASDRGRIRLIMSRIGRCPDPRHIIGSSRFEDGLYMLPGTR